MADLSALFFKAYSRLPPDERGEIIVVIDGQPYTWDCARDEINNETKLKEKILKRMKELEII